MDSDDVAVFSEKEMFEAMLQWINYDKPNRRDYLAQLLSRIRLTHISKEVNLSFSFAFGLCWQTTMTTLTHMGQQKASRAFCCSN